MKKKKFILISVLLVMYNMLFSSGINESPRADTLSGTDQIIILRGVPDLYKWLSYEVDYKFQQTSQPSHIETRKFYINNGRYAIETPSVIVRQNYSYNFSVDTVAKTIYNGPRNSPVSIIMFINFSDWDFLNNHIHRAYALDSGSVRKLVIDFKPSSQWEQYIVMYNPADMLPIQIKVAMKSTNSLGHGIINHYTMDFHNYQTSPFDESVFSNDTWFTVKDGALVLKEDFKNYNLITIPGRNK